MMSNHGPNLQTSSMSVFSICPLPQFPSNGLRGEALHTLSWSVGQNYSEKDFPDYVFCRTRVTVVCGYNSLEMLSNTFHVFAQDSPWQLPCDIHYKCKHPQQSTSPAVTGLPGVLHLSRAQGGDLEWPPLTIGRTSWCTGGIGAGASSTFPHLPIAPERGGASGGVTGGETENSIKYISSLVRNSYPWKPKRFPFSFVFKFLLTLLGCTFKQTT